MATRWKAGEQCSKTAAVRAVCWAVSDQGECPARDFYRSLDLREQVKADVLFDHLAENRVVQNEQKFRKLQGNVWEIKTANARFTCFFDSKNRLIIVDGFKKQRTKAPREEIERAESVIRAYVP